MYSLITAASIAHELTDFPVLVTAKNTATRPQLAVDPGLNKTARRPDSYREKTASSRPAQ